MRRAGSKFKRSAITWVFILAAVAMAGTTSFSAARADEAQAKSLFKTMSDYLAAQKAISFAFDSTLEVVTDQEQKLGLASSGTLTLNRPDKLHATRTGGFANVEMVYDGKTLTVLGKNANAFAKSRGARHNRSTRRRIAEKVPEARTGRGFAHVGSLQ